MAAVKFVRDKIAHPILGVGGRTPYQTWLRRKEMHDRHLAYMRSQGREPCHSRAQTEPNQPVITATDVHHYPYPSRILFEKEGVFIHTTVAEPDEDALVAGRIFIKQRREGIFIEWKSEEELQSMRAPPPEGSSEQTDGWAVLQVDSVGYKNDKTSGTVTMQAKKEPARVPIQKHKYVIDFDMADLKSFKRSRPNLGWSYLIFILKCGTTHPALHFHKGGTKLFMKELEKFLIVKRSPTDSCLYLVREHDPAALSRSFDELMLFEEQAGDVLSKFIKDPYSATMGGFSKVTGFLRDTLLQPEYTPGTSQSDMSDILAEDFTSDLDINNQEEPGFEMVTTRELPPRPEVSRSNPLTPKQWATFMDKEGRVKDVDSVKSIIFRGGVDPTIRLEVWKFLLGYYSWDSSYRSRNETRKKKVDDYFRMKLQWKSVTPDQERRFSLLKERKNLIDKDVTRTDRTHQFYEGDDNPNISMMYDILMTYCMYNFDLGYVQGMSDLLAPILVIMENEVDAFWCLAGLMERLEDNFQMDQEGMKKQLAQIHTLVKYLDPELCNYLESQDSGNMYFCFRWVLIMFKREFNFPDVMRLWEVLLTDRPCQNFHLLICLAILDNEKTTLIENNFGFTEILKHINDMCFTIELQPTLKKAEAMFYQLRTCKDLPHSVREIVGFPEGLLLPNGTFQTSSDSTPPSPDRSRLHLGDRLQKGIANGHSNANEFSTTPDDSSIEILPEQTEMAL